MFHFGENAAFMCHKEHHSLCEKWESLVFPSGPKQRTTELLLQNNITMLHFLVLFLNIDDLF